MARNRRFRLVSVTALAALSFALVGCGGNGSESSAPQDATEEATTIEDESTENTETGSTATTEVTGTETETSSSGTGTVPPAGQATVEVDGKTFVFLASDTLSERLFQCEVSDDAVTLNFQTDRHDLAVQVRRQESGEWFGSITVAPMQVEGRYGSAPNDGGAFSVDGKSVVYTGRFDFSPQDNPADFRDVGEGRVAVTCP